MEMDRQVNPAWHIHAGHLPNHPGSKLSFTMLLNLASVVNAETPDILWGFIRRYEPHLAPETHPRLDALVGHALRYFDDFVKPKKQYRPPTEDEIAALREAGWARGASENVYLIANGDKWCAFFVCVGGGGWRTRMRLHTHRDPQCPHAVSV